MGNVHLVTGYAGKVHVTAEDQASLYAALFGADSFVLTRGSRLAATVTSSNSIQIADGDVILQGRHIRLDYGSTVELALANGASGQSRNDLIAVRYTKTLDTGVEEANLVVIQGTATAGTAVDPAYNTGDLFAGNVLAVDFPLYRVPLSGLTVQDPVPLFQVFGTIPAQVQAANAAALSAQRAADAALPAASAENFLRVVGFDSSTGVLTTKKGLT